MPKKPRSLEVNCPHCMSTEDTVRLDMNDLAEITCANCDRSFSAEEAAAIFADMAAKWASIARWIDSAPTG